MKLGTKQVLHDVRVDLRREFRTRIHRKVI